MAGMMTSVVLLCALLLLGGRGTEGQLSPQPPSTGTTTTNLPNYILLSVLKQMINSNENLASLKYLFDPRVAQQEQQEPDDDVVNPNNAGPTFVTSQPAGEMDDDHPGHCTCANTATTSNQQAPEQEPDDDNMYGANYNPYGGASGTNAFTNWMSLLGIPSN